MVGLICAMLVRGLLLPTTEQHPDPVALSVRVYAEAHVDAGTVRPALEVAGNLLAAAGIAVSWRICETPAACPRDEGAAPGIVVILSSRLRRNDSEICGLAAHGSRPTAGTVIVSVPCVAAFAFRLTRGGQTRTNPLVARPRHDDLVGAIVAHELAHLLGIRHAPSGLMRATVEAGDVVALRARSLRFSPADAGRMRMTASSAFASHPHSTSAELVFSSSASASAPAADPRAGESRVNAAGSFKQF